MGLELDTLKHLIDENMLKVLQVLINNEGNDYYLRELADKSGVPPATTFRIINKLLDLKIIKMTKIKKLKIYRIEDNSQGRFLVKLLKEELDIKEILTEKVKAISNVTLAVMHGKITKNKANLLLIGENISKEAISDLIMDISDGYGFKLSALALTKDQYEQMTSMGLYSGEKEILYKN